jgi:putative serine protease PepD
MRWRAPRFPANFQEGSRGDAVPGGILGGMSENDQTGQPDDRTVPQPPAEAPSTPPSTPPVAPSAAEVPPVEPRTPLQPPYHQQYPPQQPAWYGPPTGSPFGAPQPEATPPGGGTGRVGKVVAGGLLALLLAGGGGLVGGLVVHAVDTGNVSGTATPTSTHTVAPIIDRSTLADIVASVKDSVVSIQTQDAEGSGVVITADGYVLTNNHVVADAQGNTVQVTLSDGRSVKANIVGTDPKTDLAVVKAQGVSGLAAAKFGDSGSLRVGDTVLAIGSPLGLEGSVTEGIVSALNRTIQESGNDQQSPFNRQQQSSGTNIAGAIQTDAAINPGNSGGALVNTRGEVVGINTAIATSNGGNGNIGVGFAIPGNRANEVAQDLIKGQKVSHPFIGIGVGNADNNGGASVSSVTSGSPAEKAGLKQGDVITKAGDKAIHNADDLLNVVQTSKVGDKLMLAVNRGASTVTVTVTVGESS